MDADQDRFRRLRLKVGDGSLTYRHITRLSARVRLGVCGKRSRVVTIKRTISARRLCSNGIV